MSKKNQIKPWGGRFKESTNKLVEDFTASIGFDKRLYRHDIEGSIAHAKMLAKQKIITNKERDAIIEGLKGILSDIETGRFIFKNEDEDIHMAIENALIDRIGEPGAKLHTARSRNDQVALDLRLYLRDEIKIIIELIEGLKSSLMLQAIRELDTIMPGYTHLQKAQPVLFSHYLLAHREMMDRDSGRLLDCYGRLNVMPLGAAALAGTSLPIDREYVARLLKFPSVSRNSMDTVADRDFVAEFIFCASAIMMHLSRFCEDMIIWSTDEFNYIEISDAFTTGSSLMPQKKNPDVAELIRGKTGRVYGSLFAILTVMKGLPMTYNRDMQEDKEALFDTVDTVKVCLGVFTQMITELKFNKENMQKGASGGFSSSTDVAEYLVSKGTPFRVAHGVVGRIVAYCIENGKDIGELTIDELQVFEAKIDNGVYERLKVESCVNSKKSFGGTAREAVSRQINDIKRNQ